VSIAAQRIHKRAIDLLEARNGSSLSAAEAEGLIAFFRANKYPVLALENTVAMGGLWQDAHADASASYAEQRGEYLQVREEWLKRGIECMAFKSAGIRPSFPYTSDNLDILIRREHQEPAIRVLEDLGYVWLTNTDEREKLLFRKFRSGRCVSAIHLHTWIGWDAQFHDGEPVWQRARVAPDDPNVIVPSPEDAILVNVAHALYENKQFSLFDLQKVRAHWAADLDWGYMEDVAQRRGWLSGLYFGLAVLAHVERWYFGRHTAPRERRRRWIGELRRRRALWLYYRRLTRSRQVSLPFRMSFTVSKALYYQKVLSDLHDAPSRRLTNLLHTLAWGVKQKAGLNPQPGMLVTLSGVDGAGKSAHAAALSRALSTCGVTHKVVWSRPGCSPLYRAIARLRGRSAGAEDESASANRPAPGGKASRLLWSLLNVIDLAFLYNWSVRRRLLVGNVVVCDRYTADAEVELASRLQRGDRMARRVVVGLSRVSPAPRVAYLLDLPAEDAATRSADREDAGALESQRQSYLPAAEERGMRVLDSRHAFEELNDELVRETLRSYFGRFGTLLNGLLLSNPDQLNAVARRWHRGGVR
jgi:dTMP kinase